MVEPWTLAEHIIPASHPRSRRPGVPDPQESHLRLHIKRYVPLDFTENGSAAITIIFHHGMGHAE
jgi:hypothetical protein